jgi:glyoxylase-like metal-dependent hydrolase (beta-lactamase superfamily II)
VQRTFAAFFDIDGEVPSDGSQFDRLFEDGEQFSIGGLEARVLHTPGHTPACISYIVGDACFVGDTLFMPDSGTARCDFPGGDARTLYRSIHRILSLPADTRIFVGHDYGGNGRDVSLAGDRRRAAIAEHPCWARAERGGFRPASSRNATVRSRRRH